MKLFNKTIDRQLFKQYPLGSDLSKQEVVVKIFNPYGRGTWFIINSDPEDPDYLWAIVDLGYGAEVGSVSRSDLENYRNRMGWGFERDLSFDPVNAQELYEGVSRGKFYAKGGGLGSSEENTFDKIFLHYGFTKKRGAYGVRPYEHKKLGTYAQIDDKTRSVEIETPDDEYKGGYSVKGVIEFLKSKGFEETGSYADGGGFDTESIKEEIRSLNSRIKSLSEINTKEASEQVKELVNRRGALQARLLHIEDSYAKGGEISSKLQVLFEKMKKSLSNKNFNYFDKLSNEVHEISDTKGLTEKEYEVWDSLREKQNELRMTAFLGKSKFADGGDIENFSDNQRMIMNQNVQLEHHHEELEDILEDKIPVPAWVVAKMATATESVSDVTHYLDGQKELMEDESEDEDDLMSKDVVEPIVVNSGSKTQISKKFTEDAWDNFRGFLKGMEGIDLRDDYTFDYKGEQFEIEPIINTDENGVSNAVFTIFDGDGEEVGEVMYSREGGKQKFTANSEFFSWNNAKFEDGGFMNNVYADGGGINDDYEGLYKSLRESGKQLSWQEFEPLKRAFIERSLEERFENKKFTNYYLFEILDRQFYERFKDARKELIRLKRLIFNPKLIKKVMRNNNIKASVQEANIIRGASTATKGYNLTENLENGTINTYRIDETDFNKIVADLKKAGFVIERTSEPKRDNWLGGMGNGRIDLKPYYTVKQVMEFYDNYDFEDGGYFDGTIPKVSTYMSTYADGGGIGFIPMDLEEDLRITAKWGGTNIKGVIGILNAMIDSGLTDEDLKPKPTKSGFAYQNAVEKKTKEIWAKIEPKYTGDFKGNMYYSTIRHLVERANTSDNILRRFKPFRKNQKDSFANGGTLTEDDVKVGDYLQKKDNKAKARVHDIKKDRFSTEIFVEDLYGNKVQRAITLKDWRKIAEPKRDIKEIADFAKQISGDSGLKKYILKADIKTVTVKRNGKEVTYKGADVYNGANMLSGGGDLSSKANYVPKRDVVEVELKDGSKVKPANGYWVKKGAEPIGAELTPTSSEPKIGITRIDKDSRKNWRAETNIDNFNGYDWRLSTVKTYSGKLVSSAQGGKTEKTGTKGYSMFIYAMYQDPNHTLEVSSPKRLTDKVVTEQHEKALAKFKKFMETGSFGRGGKISNFDKLSAKVAKEYEGKPVKSQYQEEYGKYYSKEEAQEVGDKVAGKVKAMQSEKKVFGGLFGSAKNVIKPKKYPNLDDQMVTTKSGEAVFVVEQSDDILRVIDANKIGTGVLPRKMNISEIDPTSYKMGGMTKGSKSHSGRSMLKEANDLAKKIRKDGESWQDAKKRAFAQLKK